MCNVVGISILVAVVAVLWGLTHMPDPNGKSYASATSADNQALLKQLGKAHDKQYNPLISWLELGKPPGACYSIKKPAKEDGALPTIDIGSGLKIACRFVCKKTKFPVVVAPACVACLTLLALPSWSHGEPKPGNPALARLPVYESGFTKLPAVPLLYPRRWASFDLRAVGLTDYAAAAEAQTLANDNWGGGVNPANTAWTINGVTRPAVSAMRAAVPPVCVEELGWITPAGAAECPGEPAFNISDVDTHFPSLDAVGGDALPLVYGTAEHYRTISKVLTQDAFRDVKGAVAATIDTMQTSYSTTIFFRNVTSSARLKELAELYGDKEWKALGNGRNDHLTPEKIAKHGDLVEVDLTYLQGVKSTAPPVRKGDDPWWNVAAHALFRVVGGGSHSINLEELPGGDGEEPAALLVQDVTFEPVAILLSNQPSDPTARLVYTPEKSETAFILATLALRQAAIQTAIWVGHVYSLHIHSAAVTAALYNTIDPKSNVYYSTHPIRQILDFYGDPTYVSEFHSSLFAAGYAAGPGTAAGVPDLFSMWNAYANKGIVHKDTSWAGNNVPGQLAASGLSEERFRGSGEKGSYAALPGLSMHLALRNKVVAPYAKALVHAAYASDEEVAQDAQVQAFAAALVSPRGSNLMRLNDEGGELTTRKQLARFLEDFVTIVVTHGTAHLQDFSMRVLNVALNPPRLGTQSAPNPTGKYTEADYLKWIPTTTTAARQYTFVANFIGTTMLPITNLVASQQFLKGGAPSWQDGTPYYKHKNADAVAQAHQEFIRKVSSFLREWPRSHGLRAVATNFQDPTRLPRVINI